MINKNIRNLSLAVLLLLILGLAFFFSKEVSPPMTKVEKYIDIKNKL